MNENIIDQWNSQVGPKDTVYVLGDFVMGQRKDTLPLGQRLNGIKRLIMGNHDTSKTTDFALIGGFTSIVSDGDVYRKFIGERKVSMCHYPYEADDRHEDRYAERYPEDKGEWILHGHVHDSWKQKGRQINVGMDAWGGRLVTEDEIIALIEAGERDLPADPWIH